jgi:hypothetical protein
VVAGTSDLPAGARDAVPPIVSRAADVFAAETRGIIGCERHFSTHIRGGPIQHSEQSDSAFVMRDGAYVRIKYYRIVQDGAVWPASKIAGRDADTNSKWSRGEVFFKEPYIRRYLSDYSFAVQNDCGACRRGSATVAFTSRVRDSQHGDGTMLIDRASGHVLALSYTPNQLPKHASWGHVAETGGAALRGLWYVTRISEQFRGHALLISGDATFDGAFDHFRRFKSLGEAEAALDAKSI